MTESRGDAAAKWHAANKNTITDQFRGIYGPPKRNIYCPKCRRTYSLRSTCGQCGAPLGLLKLEEQDG